MKYLTFLALPAAMLLCQSCTVQEGIRVNRGVFAVAPSLNHGGKAQGSSKKTRLGKPHARIRSKTEAAARRDLTENFPLDANQAYANMRIETESTGYLLFRTHRSTAVADIVEFPSEATAD